MRTRGDSSIEGWSVAASKNDIRTSDNSSGRGGIVVVGIGPGSEGYMTCGAREALEASDAIVGYKKYIKLLGGLVDEKEVHQFGMRKEIERCQKAIELAGGGKLVTLVSSGDPGVYGMAGLVLELVSDDQDIDIDVIPGVSAVNAAASALGAPLMHDFAVISLSDLLTPWEQIEKRLRAAATADFVTALYNPKSSKRSWQIKTAQDIFMQFRKPETPVGLYARERDEQRYAISDLSKFIGLPIDMNTTVIIGNSKTYVKNGRMITPRGYRL